ncbi:MAG: type II toxin-antitoxin system YafQ family toxin [Eggerthellaceae bacterium]|nr:type II toxin-antitoxin system YafQ family toxin [Eggerthellaceae bacterium]
MYELKFDPLFRTDYKRVIRKYPYLEKVIRDVLNELIESGTVPEEYRPHMLSNPGGLYNRCVDIHLSEGTVDVLLLYKLHHSDTIIRLIRMGSHNDLFRGSGVGDNSSASKRKIYRRS